MLGMHILAPLPVIRRRRVVRRGLLEERRTAAVGAGIGLAVPARQRRWRWELGFGRGAVVGGHPEGLHPGDQWAATT